MLIPKKRKTRGGKFYLFNNYLNIYLFKLVTNNQRYIYIFIANKVTLLLLFEFDVFLTRRKFQKFIIIKNFLRVSEIF